MRATIACVLAAALSACAPDLPDSGTAGPGFSDYGTYLRQREAALQNGTPAPLAPVGGFGQGAPVQPLNTQPVFSTESVGAAIDAADPANTNADGGLQGRIIGQDPVGQPLSATVPPLVAVDPNRPRGDAPLGIAPQSGEVNPNNSGISDEQEFGAVSSRETIQSDKERIARNRSQYEVVQPGALPQRPADTGPNIVKFALATTHAPGTKVYKRSGLQISGNSACRKYASPDLAQEAFLSSGGPDNDRKGLDPDGDGYACSWDPRPFRN